MLEVVKSAARAEDIMAALTNTDVRGLTGREVTVVSRQIEKLRQGADLRIAYLGSHTIEPLPQYVSVAAAARGLLVAAHLGDFNQYYQEILGGSPDLKAFDPQLIFLALSLRELAPQVYYGFSRLSAEEKRAARESIVGHVVDWVNEAIKATNASLLIANFVVPAARQAGIADLHQADGEVAFYLRLNLELLERLAGNPRAYLFDMEGVVGRYGKARAFSPTMYHLAKMPWQEGLLPHLADELLRYVQAHAGRTKKCLVLDLDNTLWGGVLGEEGPDGIEIGPGGAMAEAFLAFQRTIAMIKSRGVMLAINSKNNDEDVREAFRVRSEMPLKLEDFSAIRINWQNKHENLLAIAEELNIGVDSLVFVDDNPAECTLIEEMLPGVRVVRLPTRPCRLCRGAARSDGVREAQHHRRGPCEDAPVPGAAAARRASRGGGRSRRLSREPADRDPHPRARGGDPGAGAPAVLEDQPVQCDHQALQPCRHRPLHGRRAFRAAHDRCHRPLRPARHHRRVSDRSVGGACRRWTAS